ALQDGGGGVVDGQLPLLGPLLVGVAALVFGLVRVGYEGGVDERGDQRAGGAGGLDPFAEPGQGVVGAPEDGDGVVFHAGDVDGHDGSRVRRNVDVVGAMIGAPMRSRDRSANSPTFIAYRNALCSCSPASTGTRSYPSPRTWIAAQ